MSLKYNITYTTTSKIPYAYDVDLSCNTEHTTTDVYKVDNLKACKGIIKDLLDIPLAELSLEEVKKSFNSGNDIISEEQAVRIQTYYNGRLALYNNIMKDIDKGASAWQLMSYDIPSEYASFNIDQGKNTVASITIQKY